MKKVCAIFDIGKTNKKFFLFDESYQIVFESSENFAEIEDEDGFSCDDIGAISKWVIGCLNEKQADKNFALKAVNFSTYGASFVHISNQGQPITPLYNYLKPLPKTIENQFYEIYGDKEKIALETASPALQLLNSGLQLYWLKHSKPEIFANIKTSLHLPQYLAYRVHGQLFSDITSIGCHTALWDFKNNGYHQWVLAEQLERRLAPILATSQVVETGPEDKKLLCGVGLHDSSSAFIPYINSVKEPFVLISTGTWCITMNPFNTNPLTLKELQQDCLCYMSFKGKPVKASRLFAGFRHEQETKKMGEHFNLDPDYFKQVNFDPRWIDGSEDTTAEDRFDCENYSTYEEAYHHFVRTLVKTQKQATDLVLQDSFVTKIFVDGGFARNTIFMNLLARAYPQIEVYAATISQASALGAALVIHNHWNPGEFPQNMIRVKRFLPN